MGGERRFTGEKKIEKKTFSQIENPGGGDVRRKNYAYDSELVSKKGKAKADPAPARRARAALFEFFGGLYL